VKVKKPVSVKKTRKTQLLRRMDLQYSWGLMLLVVALVAIMGYLVVKNGQASSCTSVPRSANACRISRPTSTSESTISQLLASNPPPAAIQPLTDSAKTRQSLR
jgi:hypothetical protein